MPRMSANQRRVEFIDAAVRVVAKHGIGKATTRRIAEEARAPLASLHYCFQTKEQLLWAVWERFRDDFADSQTEAADGLSGSLADCAVNVLRRTFDWMLEHPDFAVAQFDLYQWALRRDDSPFDSFVADLFVQYTVETLRPCATAEQDAFVLPLARFMTAALDGTTVSWNAHQDLDRFHNEVEMALTAVRALVESLDSVNSTRKPKALTSSSV